MRFHHHAPHFPFTTTNTYAFYTNTTTFPFFSRPAPPSFCPPLFQKETSEEPQGFEVISSDSVYP